MTSRKERRALKFEPFSNNRKYYDMSWMNDPVHVASQATDAYYEYCEHCPEDTEQDDLWEFVH